MLAASALVVLMAGAALAQFGGPRGRTFLRKNISYDGRFTFVRLNYTTAPGGYFYRGEPAWAHGYPLAEQNLMAIMNEVSYLGPHIEEINSLTLLELVAYVEQKFAITVRPIDFAPQNFSSIDAIARFVLRRRS